MEGEGDWLSVGVGDCTDGVHSALTVIVGVREEVEDQVKVATGEGDAVGDWVPEAVGETVVADVEAVGVGDAEGKDRVGRLGVWVADEDLVPVAVLLCVGE